MSERKKSACKDEIELSKTAMICTSNSHAFDHHPSLWGSWNDEELKKRMAALGPTPTLLCSATYEKSRRILVDDLYL